MRRFVLVVLLIGFSWGIANAAIYKWVDEKGSVHFSDKAPQNQQAEVHNPAPINTFTNDSNPSNRQAHNNAANRSAANVTSHRTHKVEVYMTSWCPWCKKTVAFFRSRGIAVQTYDIEADKGAASRKAQLDPAPGVPTTVIDGQVISGYAPSAFEQALNYSN